MKVHSMSIVVEDRRCNANCPYCISKMTGFDFEEFKKESEDRKDWPPEHIDEVNWHNFEKAMAFARNCGVSTVLLTGKGEPTIQPRLIQRYVARLGCNFPFVELQTNGLLLLDEKYDHWLQRWYDEGLNTIAISVPHYIEDRCGMVFSGGKSKKYIDLPALVRKLKDIGYTVRINCVMFDHWRSTDPDKYQLEPRDIRGINNMADVKNFIGCVYEDWGVGKGLGADQLTFTPMRRPINPNNDEVARWVDQHSFPDDEFLRKIREFLHKEAMLLLQLPHGAEVFDYQGHNVCLNDCLTLNKDPEQLRQLIFFPDGRLCYDWQYHGAILLGGTLG